MDLKSYFTTNEEFEQLEDDDRTTLIIGYIDTIIAPHEAGKKKNLLLKFIVSNDDYRIEVLVWDMELIKKHLSGIVSNRVIEINGATCKAVCNSKKREELKLVLFELLIKENTDISFLGYYKLNSISNEVQSVTFEDIHASEGLIQISGYVRTKFSLTHNRNKDMTYGLGAITDKTRKLTVQMKQFSESKLEVGDYVTIRGSVTGQDELVVIFCNSMDDITYKPEEKAISPEDVRRGGRAVKRARKTSNIS